MLKNVESEEHFQGEWRYDDRRSDGQMITNDNIEKFLSEQWSGVPGRRIAGTQHGFVIVLVQQGRLARLGGWPVPFE
jgi:uncharacterized membrane-anchored protein